MPSSSLCDGPVQPSVFASLGRSSDSVGAIMKVCKLRLRCDLLAGAPVSLSAS